MTLIVLSRRASQACSPGCRPTPPGSRRRWTRPDLPPAPCDLSPVTNTLSPPPLNLTKYTAVMQHIQTFRYYCILTTVPHMMQCLAGGQCIRAPAECPVCAAVSKGYLHPASLSPCRVSGAAPARPAAAVTWQHTRYIHCTVGNGVVLTRHFAFQRASDIVLLICT